MKITTIKLYRVRSGNTGEKGAKMTGNAGPICFAAILRGAEVDRLAFQK